MVKTICTASIVTFFLLTLQVSTTQAQDVIEFLAGARVEGKVKSIDKTAREVNFTAEIAGRSITRTYPYDKIHAVTLNGKRYVLNEKDAAATTTSPRPSGTTATGMTPGGTTAGSTETSDGGGAVRRTQMQLEAYIDQQGRSKPAWFDATPLNFPKTLDLSWPEKPPGGGWQNQKNMGAYVWDIINSNPNKWNEGVVLLHHLLEVNKDNPEVVQRVMNSLGIMYHNLHQDYARAAFWWQLAGIGTGKSRYIQSVAHLASCYYRLGNKQMAVDLLKRAPNTYDVIKVWAEVGELDRALELANAFAKAQNGAPDIAYMSAGEACRTAGRYQQAIGYYNQVLAISKGSKKIDQNKKRASEALEAIKLFELTDVRKVPDGKYTSSAQGYEAPVHVEVTVSNQRIESVRVTQHREKQFYSSLTDTPAKIIEKQGVKGVDTTSNATLTSEAIINATAKALAGASQK